LNFTENKLARRHGVTDEIRATGARQLRDIGPRQLSIHTMFVVLAFAGSCLTTGCQLSGAANFSLWPVPQKCVLPPNMTKQELIRHLNHNVSRVHSWQSTDVEIGTAGVLFKMDAVIAVQQPRNFRLRAAFAATGNEADLGSNRDRFWFWMRRSPDKYVLTSSHEQAGEVQQMMKFPFRPDWLMETLGVIPLDESEFSMELPSDPAGVVRLVANRVSKSGETVRRVILVDTCRGYIIAHELYDARDRLIARATLNDYQLDANSGASLPHEIHLDWPLARLALTMKIGEIDVNPTAIPEQTWQIPNIRGYPILDLGKITRAAQPVGRARVRAVGIQDATATEPVEQPPWDETPAVEPVQNVRPSGLPRQTAEAPPSDDGPDATQWQPTSPGNSVNLTSQNSDEEPPWDNGPTNSTASVPQSLRVGEAQGYASSSEEPPWDNAKRGPANRQSAKPISVLDFLKAPFARFARRQ
jgi:hypothetical protein